jgi:integrase
VPRAATGTVEFRGNPPRWHARVTVKDATGKPRRPWVDLERPDLKNTPEDKKTAKRLALKRAKLATKGRYVGVEQAMAPRITLAELEAKWHTLLDSDVHMKASTRSTYKSCVTSRALPKLGRRSVVELRVPVLREWVRELCDELEPSTVRNNVIALTRFLSDVRAEGWVKLDANPMKHEDVRALLPTVEAPESDEIVKFAKPMREALVARPELPHDRFGLYLVALLAGLRAGELRGLTFGHLVLDEPMPLLKVRQQCALKRSAEDVEAMTAPKSRTSRREVPLHPAVVSWLTWWRDEGWSTHYRRERTDADAVFPAVDGEAGRPRDPNILRRDLKAAGQPEDFVTPEGERLPYTFHAFRRTFASMLVEAEVTGEIISMLAGHAGKTVTERHYMGRNLDAMARAVARLTLTLPERPGVAPEAPARAEETSNESSKLPEPSPATAAKVAKLVAVSQLQPIELPQFRHL